MMHTKRMRRIQAQPWISTANRTTSKLPLSWYCLRVPWKMDGWGLSWPLCPVPLLETGGSDSLSPTKVVSWSKALVFITCASMAWAALLKASRLTASQSYWPSISANRPLDLLSSSCPTRVRGVTNCKCFIFVHFSCYGSINLLLVPCSGEWIQVDFSNIILISEVKIIYSAVCSHHCLGRNKNTAIWFLETFSLVLVWNHF